MNALHIAQVIVSIILIGLILLQQRGAEGLGSSFGGGDGAHSAYRTRRGLEKGVFVTTVILAIAFIALAVASIIIA